MTTWNLVGQMTLGACVPSAVAAVAAIDASVAVALPDISARLAGCLAASAQVTFTPVQISALLESAIALTPPGVALNADAFAAVIAELQTTLGGLEAQASIGAALGLQLGTPGVWLYSVQGNAQDIIPGGIPGVSAPVQGVILLASDAGAIAALQAVFRTS